MERPSFTGWWAFAFVLLLVGAALSFWRLDPMPDLSFSLGPDMVVRSADDMESSDFSLSLQRGDRVTAVSGHAVSALHDVRSILANVVLASGALPSFKADVQAVRPLHRFTLTLTNEEFDGDGLPPGVEATDDLVEVDGRALPGKVGPEGLRSIMASRPEAILGFERRNAVFTVKAVLEHGRFQLAFLIPYGLALLLIIGLIRWSSPSLDRRMPVSVAVESAFVATSALLLLKYQWVLSDLVLFGLVAVSLIFVRPVAYLGRASADGDGRSKGPIVALGIAVVAAAGIIVLAWRGAVSTEEGLHFSALIGFFYVIYELVAGMSRGAGQSALDRGAYLIGIVVASVLAGLFAYFAHPTAFLEGRWATFAVVVIGLVWLSDIVICLRGPALTGLDEVVSQEQRRELILGYFGQLEEVIPGSKFRIVLHRDSGSVAIARGLTGYEVNSVDTALHDALQILRDEGGHVPLPEALRHTHPLAGIAQTLQMNLAMRAFAPEGAAELEGIDVFVVGLRAQRLAEPPPPLPLAVLDTVREALSTPIWMAVLLEGLPGLDSDVEDSAPPEPTIPPELVDELKGEVASLREEATSLRRDRRQLTDHMTVMVDQLKTMLAPALPAYETLLEPELLEGLHYLLESAEPIVLCGPAGAGKSFIAYAAHEVDERFPGAMITVDAAKLVQNGSDGAEVLGDELEAVVTGGALLIRSARLLERHDVKALAHRAGDKFRLFFAFDEPDPEANSALEKYGQEVQALLEHREMIVPAFHRRFIREDVIFHYFEYASARHRKALIGISPAALDALLTYDFPGGVSECVALMNAAVARCDGEVLDLADFPVFPA